MSEGDNERGNEGESKCVCLSERDERVTRKREIRERGNERESYKQRLE